MRTITRLRLRRFRGDRRGVSNIIVIVLSIIVLTIIVSNVILWSYQMNQHDWEQAHEDIKISRFARATISSWFSAQNEYTLNIGSLHTGSYVNTQTLDNSCESFTEEPATLTYYPSVYLLKGSTAYVSGSVADLHSNDGVCMVFRSYASATSAQEIYAHRETTTIGGATFRLLALNSADSTGTTLTVTTDTVGRKLTDKFVYPLTGVSSIPASTWTVYYRAIKSSSAVTAHGDADVVIRKTDGTIRTTIATNVANSGAITTSWSTVSGTSTWSSYTVVDQTDVLEMDYYIEVTNSSPGKTASLRIDDNTLAPGAQTRVANVYLPSEFTSEVEFSGSSDTQDWIQLVWTSDSAWTAGSVSVTLQMYNYTLGGYPTSGNGYVNYTSSTTANTKEKKNQPISQNPSQFRNASGSWKVKIKGVKTTTSSFDFKSDWVMLRPSSAHSYQLDLHSGFRIDLATYPLSSIKTVEMLLRFRTTDVGEKWFLKAYDWASMDYSAQGFNVTAGHTPTEGWNQYAVNLTNSWRNYVDSHGKMNVKLTDNGPDNNQTTVDVDFLAVRAKIDGADFTFKNEGSVTSHIVSLWIINASVHRRYDVDIFINSADTSANVRPDISVSSGQFTAKVVTERGNVAVYSGT